MKDEKLSPMWYAVGSIFVVPPCALLIFLMSVLFLCGWPFIPFLVYRQKKEEMAKDKS